MKTLTELNLEPRDVVVHVESGVEYEIWKVETGRFLAVSDEEYPHSLVNTPIWDIKKRYVDPVELVAWAKDHSKRVNDKDRANMALWLSGAEQMVPPLWLSYYESKYRKALARDEDPEYQEYLRLKEKFDE